MLVKNLRDIAKNKKDISTVSDYMGIIINLQRAANYLLAVLL